MMFTSTLTCALKNIQLQIVLKCVCVMNVRTLVCIKNVGLMQFLFAYVVVMVRRSDTTNLHGDIELFLTMLMRSPKLLLCFRAVFITNRI
jgi:hypothetical protein